MNKPIFFLSCLTLGLWTATAVKSQTKNPKKDIEAGKALLSKSDCAGCHKIAGKLIGPSYADIAKKYKATDANITKLSQKIIKGGSGVWGQIPMAAHPQITPVDAKKMVKYILSGPVVK